MKVKSIKRSNDKVTYILLPNDMTIINNWGKPIWACTAEISGYGMFFVLTPFRITTSVKDKIQIIRECIGRQLDDMPNVTENDLLNVTTLYSPLPLKKYLQRKLSGHLQRYDACIVSIGGGNV